jgi:hypothetical protein
MRLLSLVGSPVTGENSLGEKSRARGAGLLEGCSQHLQAAPGSEDYITASPTSRLLLRSDELLLEGIGHEQNPPRFLLYLVWRSD